jgi:hypothetical protein
MTLKIHVDGKLAVRGGDASLEFLHWANQIGCEMIIVTAQEPRKAVIKNLINEVRRMGLSSLFECEEWDHACVDVMFEAWGDNSKLSDERLQAKLATLLSLFSGRFPSDLARLMHSSTHFFPSSPPECFTTPIDGVEYRMVQETKEGQSLTETCGGPLVIKAQKNPFICPVRCWLEYDRRFRTKYRSQYTPNRTFLRLNAVRTEITETPHPSGKYFEYDCHTEKVDVFEALTAKELTEIVRRTLEEANSPQHHINDVLFDTIIEHDVHCDQGDVVKICQKGRLFASRYNKPEAIDLFMRNSKEPISHILFFDDSPSNTLNVYSQFRNTNLLSVWWIPPPSVTTDEGLPFNIQCMEILHKKFVQDREDKDSY